MTECPRGEDKSDSVQLLLSSSSADGLSSELIVDDVVSTPVTVLSRLGISECRPKTPKIGVDRRTTSK